MRGMRFEQTRSGHDVYHQRYVRVGHIGHCACARMPGVRFTESGPGRIWAQHSGSYKNKLGMRVHIYFNLLI